MDDSDRMGEQYSMLNEEGGLGGWLNYQVFCLFCDCFPTDLSFRTHPRRDMRV